MKLHKENKPMIRYLLVLALSLMVSVLAGCKSKEPKASTFSDAAEARKDFQRIADVADVIFWHATDKCLRENSNGLSAVTTLEIFTRLHECEIMEVKEVVDGKDRSYVATVKMWEPPKSKNPNRKQPDNRFELVFEEAGNGWEAIDAKLIMDGHEMNYFEGRFLSLTNLKPYMDEATKQHARK